MIEFKNNVGVFDSCPTVENISTFTYRELLQYYHNKLKETIDNFNIIENEFNKLDEYCKSNIEYLLSNGMYEELKKFMKKLYDDGLLSSIVNENLLIDLDKRYESIIGINFLDYGGVNDGVTDNRIALQNLVIQLKNRGGGKIFFPKGSYYFSRKENTIYSVNVESNISFIGSGMGTTIFLIGDGTKENDEEGYSLFFHNRNSSVQNATYSNFTVNAYKMTINEETNNYTHKGKALFFEGANNCVFRDIEIVGTPSTGFGVDFMNNCIIDNVNCYECGRLWIENFDDGKGNIIEGAGGAGIGIGTGLYEVENVKIVNCTCVKCGHYGIFLEHQNMFNSYANKVSKGNIIVNNIVHHCKHGGIGVRGGSNVIVSNNNIYENKFGVVIDSGETSIKELLTIKDLIINSNTIKGNTESGVKLGNNINFDNLLISNNIIRYNKTGIQFINNNPNVICHNLKLTGNIYNNNSFKDLNFIDTNIKEFENNDKFSIVCGKGYFNPESYLTSNTNILNNFQSIELKFSFSSIGNHALISTKQEETTTSNEIKGMTLLLNDENKLVLRYNLETDGARKTITFNKVFEKDKNITLKIYRDNKECVIKYKIDDGDFLNLENASTNLLNDIEKAFSTNKNKILYFGKEFDGNSFKNFCNGVTFYYLSIIDKYNNSKEFGFDNVGIDKLIKDKNDGGYNIIPHNNFIQKLS